MDNQHQYILGYRELDAERIHLINQIKEVANNLGDTLAQYQGDETVDQRWLAIAKTDLQKGFMALVRSVAKPEGF